MESIPLSPIDHVFTGVGSYPIEFVFAYADNIDEGRLRSSLEETLQHFPPARSKLIRISDNSYVFEVSDDEVHFATVDSSVSFDETQERYSFIDPVNSVEDEPLIRIRLTQTPKGSVLGVSMSHAVADGFSYFYLLASWARLFHAKSVLAPSHQRDLLIPAQPARDGRLTSEDVLRESGLFWEDKRDAIPRDQLVWETVTISKPELRVLLQKAQEECEIRLSHNDVIAASLWKRYIGKWNAGDEQLSTYVSCPVDFRRVLKPFPRTYFGCAVSLATASLDYGSLIDASMAQLALKVRATVAGVNEGYIRNGLATLEALRRQEGLSVLEESHVIHPHSGLLVTNLSRLPVQEIEFDAGPPIAYDILTPAPRGAVVLPGRDGVEIRVCCPAAIQSRVRPPESSSSSDRRLGRGSERPPAGIPTRGRDPA
ncbi:MAG: acyltransferase [Gemmatimonadota bacterium]